MPQPSSTAPQDSPDAPPIDTMWNLHLTVERWARWRRLCLGCTAAVSVLMAYLLMVAPSRQSGFMHAVLFIWAAALAGWFVCATAEGAAERTLDSLVRQSKGRFIRVPER